LKKSFNIQELLHPKSKGHGIKPMHPSSWRAFQRLQRSWNQAHAPLLVESFSKTPKVMESSPCTPPCGELFKESEGHGIMPTIETFPKIPRTRSEASWFSGSHDYKTKQSTLIDIQWKLTV
jgi:hypothetical protein